MELIILGAGGYGQTVADVARQQLHRYDRIFFLDDHAQGENILGRCEDFEKFLREDREFYPAFGNNEGRLFWLNRLQERGCQVAAIIHPDAYVSPSAEIGQGTVVLPKAAVGTNTRIGRGCILNMGSLVDHGCVLEDGVHVCLGAIVKAENRIPEGMKIEAGTVIERSSFKGEK